MTTDDLKIIATRYFDAVWNQHDVDAIDDLFAPDFVDHYLSVPRTPDRDGFKEECSVCLTAFPDTSVTIEDQIAERDRVVSRVLFRTTHTGPFGPVPPTGRTVETTGCIILRIAGGLIVERWGTSTTSARFDSSVWCRTCPVGPRSRNRGPDSGLEWRQTREREWEARSRAEQQRLS